ncbi:MAG: hypothetical protein KKH41_02995 [Candidatus Thermoplasmatota archaeon]|nr:hypothetical protein [Euryarchaeota archaeon]MBU4032041.1 hypothetical protein [Candidatus Thermoplasmatota archaeon]MBU4070735.1 hypothetical protein [Candidatus Thermoplasmatota archaeon]MBU4145169.1 hypothetical protein [Candidatus Thermoplasmatota archaeon]MBU4591531.1 hypothetical protein [Candidatus Thermoplasmatota archaeon]
MDEDTVCKGRDSLDNKTTQELVEEIKQLRNELRHMREIVNSLVNIVMDYDEEEYDVTPTNQRFLDMYN